MPLSKLFGLGEGKAMIAPLPAFAPWKKAAASTIQHIMYSPCMNRLPAIDSSFARMGSGGQQAALYPRRHIGLCCFSTWPLHQIPRLMDSHISLPCAFGRPALASKYLGAGPKVWTAGSPASRRNGSAARSPCRRAKSKSTVRRINTANACPRSQRRTALKSYRYREGPKKRSGCDIVTAATILGGPVSKANGLRRQARTASSAARLPPGESLTTSG